MKKMLTLSLLALTLAGCAKAPALTPTNIEVVKHSLTNKELVVGTVKNTTHKKISSLQIRFNFYNKEGKVIGTAYDRLSALAPEETWFFDAGLHGVEFKDVYKFECVEVTGIPH